MHLNRYKMGLVSEIARRLSPLSTGSPPPRREGGRKNKALQPSALT